MGDDAVGFEKGEGGAKGVASNLELGSKGAFAGEETLQVAGGDHFSNDPGRLGGKRLAIWDP